MVLQNKIRDWVYKNVEGTYHDGSRRYFGQGPGKTIKWFGSGPYFRHAECVDGYYYIWQYENLEAAQKGNKWTRYVSDIMFVGEKVEVVELKT
jgi:hypothetical protein